MIPISHTRLQVFRTCPRQFAGRYVWQTLVDEGGPAADYGNMIHASIAAYLSSGGASDLHQDIVGLGPTLDRLRSLPSEHHIERRYAVDIKGMPCPWYDSSDPERTWLRVILDYLIVRDTGAVVVDWKTGRKKPQEHDAQARLYAAVVFAQFPAVERVDVSFVFTKTLATYTVSHTRGDLRLLLADAVDAYEEILDYVADDMWPARPGVHCRWCADHGCEARRDGKAR